MISPTIITLDLTDALALRDAAKLALRQELSSRHYSSFSKNEVRRLLTCLRAIKTAIRP
jgi:hypothetical protein